MLRAAVSNEVKWHVTCRYIDCDKHINGRSRATHVIPVRSFPMHDCEKIIVESVHASNAVAQTVLVRVVQSVRYSFYKVLLMSFEF